MKKIMAIIAGIACIGALAFVVITSTRPEQKGWTNYTVNEGDTLYSIALTVSSDVDWREVVYTIKQKNELADDTIYPGDVLAIPEY